MKTRGSRVQFERFVRARRPPEICDIEFSEDGDDDPHLVEGWGYGSDGKLHLKIVTYASWNLWAGNARSWEIEMGFLPWAAHHVLQEPEFSRSARRTSQEPEIAWIVVLGPSGTNPYDRVSCIYKVQLDENSHFGLMGTYPVPPELSHRAWVSPKASTIDPFSGRAVEPVITESGVRILPHAKLRARGSEDRFRLPIPGREQNAIPKPSGSRALIEIERNGRKGEARTWGCAGDHYVEIWPQKGAEKARGPLDAFHMSRAHFFETKDVAKRVAACHPEAKEGAFLLVFTPNKWQDVMGRGFFRVAIHREGGRRDPMYGVGVPRPVEIPAWAQKRSYISPRDETVMDPFLGGERVVPSRPKGSKALIEIQREGKVERTRTWGCKDDYYFEIWPADNPEQATHPLDAFHLSEAYFDDPDRALEHIVWCHPEAKPGVHILLFHHPWEDLEDEDTSGQLYRVVEKKVRVRGQRQKRTVTEPEEIEMTPWAARRGYIDPEDDLLLDPFTGRGKLALSKPRPR